MKKKLLSIILSLVMLFTSGAGVLAAATVEPLTDITGTKYETAVNSLQALGIINGYEDGTYRGEKSITRAELTKILIAMLNFVTVDSYKGATRFTDVPVEHWATGFINIAADRGIVNGYEDGTFHPDEPIKYSEAITMIMRVLGYQNVIESQGTWPINYIAKARELEVLKDVSYNNYADYATRGDIALMIWNALHAETWGVISESQGNGLTFGPCDCLLTKLYTNYLQIEDTVVNVYINADKEVYITLKESGDVKLPADTEFLNLYGKRVSLTYNTEDEMVISLTVLENNKTVAGYKNNLIKDGYAFSENELKWGEAKAKDTDYITAVLGSKKKEITYTTRYSLGESAIVESINIKDEKTIVKCDKKNLTIENDAIILLGNKWLSVKDLEEGDIITVLKTNKLYAISRNSVTGTFKSVKETTDNRVITLDKTEYSVLNGVKDVVELDKDGEEVTKTSLTSILNNKDSKFYGEKATLYIDFLGEVAKITFDEILEEKTEDFHILTYVLGYWVNYADRELTAYTELDGEEYEFKYNTLPTNTNVNGGDLVYVKLDNKDRIVEFYDLTELIKLHHYYMIGDFLVKGYTNFKDMYEDGYIDDTIKVTKDTAIIKVNGVEVDGEIEYYETERLSRDELKDIKNCLVIFNPTGLVKKAKYIYTWEDVKNTDKHYGVVESYMKENGKEYLTIDNVRYELGELTVEFTTNSLEGKPVEYTINDNIIDITRVFTYKDIENANIITAAEEELYKVEGNPDSKKIDKDKIILIAEVDGTEIISIEKIDFKDLNLHKGDKIFEDTYLYVIITE